MLCTRTIINSACVIVFANNKRCFHAAFRIWRWGSGICILYIHFVCVRRWSTASAITKQNPVIMASCSPITIVRLPMRAHRGIPSTTLPLICDRRLKYLRNDAWQCWHWYAISARHKNFATKKMSRCHRFFKKEKLTPWVYPLGFTWEGYLSKITWGRTKFYLRKVPEKILPPGYTHWVLPEKSYLRPNTWGGARFYLRDIPEKIYLGA